MSCANVTNVLVRNNPAGCLDDFEFEVSFECIQSLEQDLEWKLTYVGSPKSDEYDQELDAIDLGPIAAGAMRFVLQAPAPDFSRIPKDDILGVTAVLLTGAYKGSEFLRVGYYVNNFYQDEALQENPPEEIDFSKVSRAIIADKPRVTRFTIDWDAPNPELQKPADDLEGEDGEDGDDSEMDPVEAEGEGGEGGEGVAVGEISAC